MSRSWCAARTGGSNGWSRPELRSHPPERDHWYHEIRKAAKRLRYAGEAVEPAFGAPAAALAENAENLQEVLGEHQDSVVARQALRELGARIHLEGENAFTIGRLHALEQTRADEAAAEFDSSLAGGLRQATPQLVALS